MSTAAADVLPSPLPAEPLVTLERVATSLSPDQLLWASGYLAGRAAAAAPEALPAPQADTAIRWTVIYATETGNSRRVARALVDRARARGLRAQAVDAREYKLAKFKGERHVVIVAATHGLGEPPDGSEDFVEFVLGERAPRLDGLHYSVLALGDSSYDDYCQVGRDLDARLEALGATRVAPRVDCDVDFDDAAQRWTEAFLDAAAKLEADAPRPAGAHLRPVPAPPAASREAPFEAEVLVNQPITGRHSSKRVHHLALSLEGSGLRYQPGDALGVVTDNPPELVEDLLATLGATGRESVRIGDDTLTLTQALRTRLDITASSRAFVAHYAQATGHAGLAAKLDALKGEAARAFFWRHQIVDVLREYPAAIAPQALVDGLRKLAPRLYSIASSPDANPDEVHLTVAHVRYDAFGHAHLGSASTELVRRNGSVPVYVEENPHFRLPDDGDAPIIMIGPGTGVAPFRAFLEHRAEHGAGGDNWLFFGDRTFREDFLYQIEMQRHLKRGVLTRLDLAFSRDTAEKVYVQHRLRERGAEVFAWLERGAHVYVCGDAERMAPDVHAALAGIVADAGGRSTEDAEAYLRDLKRTGRYQRDVY